MMLRPQQELDCPTAVQRCAQERVLPNPSLSGGVGGNSGGGSGSGGGGKAAGGSGEDLGNNQEDEYIDPARTAQAISAPALAPFFIGGGGGVDMGVEGGGGSGHTISVVFAPTLALALVGAGGGGSSVGGDSEGGSRDEDGEGRSNNDIPSVDGIINTGPGSTHELPANSPAPSAIAARPGTSP